MEDSVAGKKPKTKFKRLQPCPRLHVNHPYSTHLHSLIQRITFITGRATVKEFNTRHGGVSGGRGPIIGPSRSSYRYHTG